MGPMDCTTVADRVAAYLDGELSKSEQLLFEEHLERCTVCQALVEGVAEVDLRPPPPTREASAPGFWRRMDVALQSELAAAERPAAPAVPGARRWSQASLRVSLPLLVGYAALLLLAVLWGAQNLRRAQVAEAQIDAYVESQRATIEVIPEEVAPVGLDKGQVVTYTTHRGQL